MKERICKKTAGVNVREHVVSVVVPLISECHSNLACVLGTIILLFRILPSGSLAYNLNLLQGNAC